MNEQKKRFALKNALRAGTGRTSWVAWVAIALAAGCAPILGIDDARPIEGAGDDASGGGSTNDGGSTGNGGPGSSNGGSSSSNGDGGSAPNGSGGDGGSTGPGSGGGDPTCGEAQVVAAGSPGMVANFENGETCATPLMGDGRVGSWSVYGPFGTPQCTVLQDPTDSGNSVIQLLDVVTPPTADNWTGISVAFIDDDGSTYDASEYLGVAFRIRGHVASNEDAGIVTFSVVTAETQADDWGGCLPPDVSMGHFHTKIVVGENSAAASDWIDVSVTWSNLLGPLWAEPPSTTIPSTVAVTKLLGLEWSVDQFVSDVDVYIDDVELIEK